jgi:hypothetical protein
LLWTTGHSLRKSREHAPQIRCPDCLSARSFENGLVFYFAIMLSEAKHL